VSLPDVQKFVSNNGKHTTSDEQHELTTHTKVSDAQAYVILSHGSKIENARCTIATIIECTIVKTRS
jgi:hypothetical protein